MLPDSLGPEAFTAQAGQDLRGEYALGELERLEDLLRENDGVATVELRCSLDDEGRRRLVGRVRATLALQCQRCLGTCYHPVDSSFDVIVVASPEEGAALPEELEPFLTTEGRGSGKTGMERDRVIPRVLVEEELLLALPPVTLHGPEDACHPPEHEAGFSAEERSPFASLRGRVGSDSTR